MTYKITVQDGPVSVAVETEVADEAVAVLAVSVLQKVQRSKYFDAPKYWEGPDGRTSDRLRIGAEWNKLRDTTGRIWEESFTHNPFTTSS